MTICRIEQADADRLLEVWNRTATFDPLSSTLLDEKLWGDADFDPALALAWREAGEIAAFGIAVCRPVKNRVTGYVKMIAVAPESQRRGIGAQLYQTLEERCGSLGAVEMRVGESAPNYLVPGVDERYGGAVAFFERQGFLRSGKTCNQRVDLRRWSNPHAREDNARHGGIAFTRARVDDVNAIRELLKQHWPSWWPEVSNSLADDPPSVFVARDKNAVVGFAAHNGNNRGTGWFGPMGTAPSYRGMGIGGRLLAVCLDDMQQAGYPTATIPWVGPVEFYQAQAGAVIDRVFIRYTKPLTASTT